MARVRESRPNNRLTQPRGLTERSTAGTMATAVAVAVVATVTATATAAASHKPQATARNRGSSTAVEPRTLTPP